MHTFAELLARSRKSAPHIDPALERAARDLLEPSMESRSNSLALRFQEVFNDWLDEQEQADRKAAPTDHADDCGIRTRGICDCGEWP